MTAKYLTYLLCMSISKHEEACKNSSEALYKSVPEYYRHIDGIEQEANKLITPEISLAVSVATAYASKQVNIQIINREF